MIILFDTPENLFADAAKRIAAVAILAVNAKGSANMVLAGGQTPRGVYRQLTQPPYQDSIAWDRLRFFWGDERCVPPESEGSNYRMARETLLDHAPVNEDCVFRIHGEKPPEEASEEYDFRIQKFYSPTMPCFDVVMLGLGEDGHTASLFPGSKALEETQRLAVAVSDAPKPPPERVTLTLPALNATRLVLFLVSGSGKAEALARVLNPEPDNPLPAARIAPAEGEVVWLVDREAGAQLPPGLI